MRRQVVVEYHTEMEVQLKIKCPKEILAFICEREIRQVLAFQIGLQIAPQDKKILKSLSSSKMTEIRRKIFTVFFRAVKVA